MEQRGFQLQKIARLAQSAQSLITKKLISLARVIKLLFTNSPFGKLLFGGSAVLTLFITSLAFAVYQPESTPPSPQDGPQTSNTSTHPRSVTPTKSNNTAAETTPPASTESTLGTQTPQTQSSTATSVTIDGKPVPVPENGETSQVIVNENGETTKVQISNKSSHVSSGNQPSDTDTRIRTKQRLDSDFSITSEIKTKTRVSD